jgi:hypothetical protein
MDCQCSCVLTVCSVLQWRCRGMEQTAVLCAAVCQLLCEGERRMDCQCSCVLTVCSVLQW